MTLWDKPVDSLNRVDSQHALLHVLLEGLELGGSPLYGYHASSQLHDKAHTTNDWGKSWEEFIQIEVNDSPPDAQLREQMRKSFLALFANPSLYAWVHAGIDHSHAFGISDPDESNFHNDVHALSPHNFLHAMMGRWAQLGADPTRLEIWHKHAHNAFPP